MSKYNDDSYLGLLKHIETGYNNKINYFILAQSMFVVGLCTIYKEDSCILKISIIVLAMCYSIIWKIISCRSFTKLGDLKKQAEKESKNYKSLKSNNCKYLSNNSLSGIVIPVLSIIFWIVVLVDVIEHLHYYARCSPFR